MISSSLLRIYFVLLIFQTNKFVNSNLIDLSFSKRNKTHQKIDCNRSVKIAFLFQSNTKENSEIVVAYN